MLSFLRSFIQDPATLTEQELEPEFVNLKNKILITNVYTESEKHRKLYDGIGIILARLLTRHERYTLDIESQPGSYYEISKLFHSGFMPNTLSPTKIEDKSGVANEYLFYASFFAYLGGVARNIGMIYPDPEYAIVLLDYLILERNYSPAIFLKGFIYKYGVRREDVPNLSEAKELLIAADNKGIGGATIELRQFDIHERSNKYDQAIAQCYRR